MKMHSRKLDCVEVIFAIVIGFAVGVSLLSLLIPSSNPPPTPTPTESRP